MAQASAARCRTSQHSPCSTRISPCGSEIACRMWRWTSTSPTGNGSCPASHRLSFRRIGRDRTPCEQLVEALQPDRDASRTPLFDVMVLLHTAQREPPGFVGLQVEEVRVPRQAATFDISLDFEEYGDVLAGVLEYNTDLF